MNEAFIGRKEFPKDYLKPETVASAILAQILFGQRSSFSTWKVTFIERYKGFPCLAGRENSGTRFQSHLRLSRIKIVIVIENLW
jgi:hypothetical protein